MAEILPFAALRYDTAKYKLEDVLTQPYDKITPAMQEKYSARHPDNLIAIEKGQTLPDDSPADNVYTRAAAALQDWVARRVLVQESAPAIYAYFQDYRAPGSAERKERQCFIALGRVQDYSAGVVHRHEQTLAGPRADRLELLRHTRTHTGQLFMMYSDATHAVDALLEEAARRPATAEVRDEYDVRHRLWTMSDPARITEIQRLMRDKKLVIADGHHRYETALAYRNEQRAATGNSAPDAPHEKVMMTFINTHYEGLLILPTHRVVANLANFDPASLRGRLAAWFEITVHEDSGAGRIARFRDELVLRGLRARVMGLYAGGQCSFLTLRSAANLDALLAQVGALQRQLDVVLLHRLVLEKGLGITPDAVSVEQTVAMALAGEVLPQKSTDFYPKLLSGLAIYRLGG